MNKSEILQGLKELGKAGVGGRIVVIGSAAALRPQDLDDLKEIDPTEEEIEFVRQQLPRIARIDQGKALRVELYLEQGTDQ